MPFGSERRRWKRGILAGSLIAAGAVILWARALQEEPASAAISACLWGCPTVLEELVVDSRTPVAPAPESPERALQRALRCDWGRAREPHLTVFYDDDEKPLRIEQDGNGDGR